MMTDDYLTMLPRAPGRGRAAEPTLTATEDGHFEAPGELRAHLDEEEEDKVSELLRSLARWVG